MGWREVWRYERSLPILYTPNKALERATRRQLACAEVSQRDAHMLHVIEGGLKGLFVVVLSYLKVGINGGAILHKRYYFNRGIQPAGARDAGSGLTLEIYTSGTVARCAQCTRNLRCGIKDTMDANSKR